MYDPVLIRHNNFLAENARRRLKDRSDRAKLARKQPRKKGRGDEPPENELNKLSQAVYSDKNDVTGYQLLESIPTIGIYKKIADNTIVIVVRGSADLQDWITNAQLPFNNLVNTARYRTDKQYVMNAIQKYGEGNDIYITGHSLGGVVAEQLKRDFEQIRSGKTFNPAFQTQDLFNRNDSTVKRKYTYDDPLGVLGRYLKGAEVEDDRNILQKTYDFLIPRNYYKYLKGHNLQSFQSGKGKKEVVKMDKKDYVKEHKRLIKLLEDAGKEGKAQKKELKKEMKKDDSNPDGYALHAVIIKKKGYDKNDAVAESAKFKTEKGLFMRETKLSYRFRNIPKTKFEPKTFRTKKINKNVSLVYGKLK